MISEWKNSFYLSLISVLDYKIEIKHLVIHF